MSKGTVVTLMRLILALILCCWGANQANAQQGTGKSAKANAPTQATARMRSLTMAQRRAAATRNTARKLAAGRKNQAIQGGVSGVRK